LQSSKSLENNPIAMACFMLNQNAMALRINDHSIKLCCGTSGTNFNSTKEITETGLPKVNDYIQSDNRCYDYLKASTNRLSGICWVHN